MFYKTLSARQKEITDAMILGKTNEQIGAELNVAIQTIKYHVAVLYKKAAVKNRAQYIVKIMTEFQHQEPA